MDKEQQIKKMKSDFVAVMCDCYGDETEISDSFVEGVHNIGYCKVPVGAVVLTQEELAKHDEYIRKETAREILDKVAMRYGGGWLIALYKEYGVEV